MTHDPLATAVLATKRHVFDTWQDAPAGSEVFPAILAFSDVVPVTERDRLTPSYLRWVFLTSTSALTVPIRAVAISHTPR
jgi:hypothetical protein